MTKHIAGNVYLRHRALPAGFKPYKKGQGCPVEPHQFVELMIRTTEGAGSSNIRRALFCDWEQGEPNGIGQVVGFRVVEVAATEATRRIGQLLEKKKPGL